MSLSAEQMAFRAAREARDGEVVFIGGGLAAKVRRYLPSGVRIVDKEPGARSVDVAFLSANKICARGDIISSTRSNSKTHCDWSTVPDCDAGRIVVLMPHTADGKSNIVEHRSQQSSGEIGRELRRIVCVDGVSDGLTPSDGSSAAVSERNLSPERPRRIITDLALIDITDRGPVLRELAPGVNAREVQGVTGTLLLVGPDLSEMELCEPLP
jgi:acyl CoA:acetate/3-ketoacid CoA transferase beta subunit